MNLYELAKKHGARKVEADARDYLDIYTEWFTPRRNQVERLLEIGIDGGGSLKMWNGFFPRAQIVGVDHVNNGWEFPEGIDVWIGEQQDVEFWNRVLADEPPFDIIIDDGSHKAEHQVATLEYLWPELKPGGLYVIEDLHCSYWDFEARWPYGLGSPKNIAERFLKPLVDLIHFPFWNRNYTDEKYRGENLWQRAGGATRDEPITPFQRELKGMHLYRSLVILEKR